MTFVSGICLLIGLSTLLTDWITKIKLLYGKNVRKGVGCGRSFFCMSRINQFFTKLDFPHVLPYSELQHSFFGACDLDQTFGPILITTFLHTIRIVSRQCVPMPCWHMWLLARLPRTGLRPTFTTKTKSNSCSKG